MHSNACIVRAETDNGGAEGEVSESEGTEGGPEGGAEDGAEGGAEGGGAEGGPEGEVDETESGCTDRDGEQVSCRYTVKPFTP